MLLASISAVWFFNAGTTGGGQYFLIVPIIFSMILLRGKKRIFLVALTILAIITLIVLEYLDPGIVAPYPDRLTRYIDITVSIILSFMAIALMLNVILRYLDREKKELMMQKMDLENQIVLARNIQEQLIPSRAPASYIHSLYRPMEMVGGDFFDFVRFRESNKIGFFISDVSGHGVPAAFITSMIKTTILQAAQRRENPAELLHYLNEVLYDRTGGNFITAFYALYDPSTRTLTYSNAGHNPPYLIAGDSVSQLIGMKSVPIAIVDNHYLHGYGKSYRNTTTVLPQGSKLLMYTDGLMEARSLDDDTMFFDGDENDLSGILTQLRGLSSEAFIAALFARLVAFRGSSSFDDDVCIICVDIV
jgi:serine phosphatase RsbU (regulator of sigma subunit)